MITNGVGARVEAYCNGVLSGEIVACQRVQDAVARYLRDIERQSTQDFPYHFDRAWATQVCQFFPLVLRHSIGQFAGMPLELEPWQAFCIWNIFGWKRDCDNTRRFRRVYWSMGRKNGKSTIAAGICLFMGSGDIDPKTGKPEAVGQILLTATKKEQAAVVYGECERMRLQSRPLAKLSHVKNETITFNHNQSFIRKVSSDKPFDGLNPLCVVMDEMHAWGPHHRDFYDTMITGSGSRSQPLNIVITTAGAEDSDLWLEQYKYAVSILKQVEDDEALFAAIYELDEEDDPSDERNWVKSNPNLGVSISQDYLAQRWKEDSATSVGRNRFMRYHGNRIVSSSEQAFDQNHFQKCVGELSDWTKADAYGAGLDLGSRDDLAAYALCARFPMHVDEEGKQVYRYEFKIRSYIAEECKRNLKEMPFAQFVYNGELTVAKYPINLLEEELDLDMQKYGIEAIAYDPHNAQSTAERLEQAGVKNVDRMGQTTANFNEPIRDIQVLMEEGRLRFEDSKLLRWCFNNAVIRRDNKDYWMFDKKSSREKIDPVVAAVMAYRVASRRAAIPQGPLHVTGG